MEGKACSSSCSSRNNTVVAGDCQLQQVAPFVAKTYQMVNDPKTSSLVCWGKGNNSFLVLHPNEFSQFLLPSYFKHSNFSSFVRQLNTYGFRKVDPDRWEFAHESFLRGQVHLLYLIIRHKKRSTQTIPLDGSDTSTGKDSMDSDEEALLDELIRLREEQEVLREELKMMSKRLLDTERKPQQMMSFLLKIAEDPELLPRLVLSKKKKLLVDQARKNKRQRIVSDTDSFVDHTPNYQQYEYNPGVFWPLNNTMDAVTVAVAAPGFEVEEEYKAIALDAEFYDYDHVNELANYESISSVNGISSPRKLGSKSYPVNGPAVASAEVKFPFSLCF